MRCLFCRIVLPVSKKPTERKAPPMSTLVTRIAGQRVVFSVAPDGSCTANFDGYNGGLPYELRSIYSSPSMAACLLAALNAAMMDYVTDGDSSTCREVEWAENLLAGRQSSCSHYFATYADFTERICSGCGQPV